MRPEMCFMTQKGILAFSGGLDTSVVVKYLQEEHDMDVIMRAEVDHVYVANQGEIITHGSPEEVKQNKEVIEAYLGK